MTEIEVQRIVIETIAKLLVSLLIASIVLFVMNWLINKYVDWKWKRLQKKNRRDEIERSKGR